MGQQASDTRPSAVDRLRGVVADYAAAKIGSAAEGLGKRVSHTTQRLGDRFSSDGPDSGGPDSDSPGSGGSGSDSGSGGEAVMTPGDPKVTTVIETLDVGVPLRAAYDHWTQYEEFGKFAKGVQSVSKDDDTVSKWNTKIAASSRSFEATVQEQIPDDRIVWTSQGPKGSTQGAVSFHELAPTLTRVVLVVEYRPSGFFEKTGNLWRAQGRRIRLDFKHFQRYVTLAEEQPEGWRGEIRDGEVVRTDEEVRADEEDDAEEPDSEGDDGEHDDEEDDGSDEQDEDDGEFDEHDDDAEDDDER
ncbi:SRPBCC family protein [Streptomyces sp. P38-E01]|uniref:SRPBCC family protein n=1 Tax=Streptomyces tardus TaxID=2780544 RepID=A0A949JKH7_9ACTN|nr:SRPBCC family protein [Streptomyces tardus]MBU7596836.1 SRPBCC family protein [Streptomyces tardus]